MAIEISMRGSHCSSYERTHAGLSEFELVCRTSAWMDFWKVGEDDGMLGDTLAVANAEGLRPVQPNPSRWLSKNLFWKKPIRVADEL